jgi:hypothetical protein
MRITDELLKKRKHYRHEFAIRSKRYEERKKEIAELENIRGRPNYVKNIAVDNRYFELLAELLVDVEPAILSTIQVKHRDRWLGLNYKELPTDPEFEKYLDIHAVDKREKSLIIKIHLDRKKEDIIKDVKFLLGLLDKQAKSYKVGLKAKRPQWDVYDKYLQVYDLKKANLKMTWSDIAIKVFPDEIFKNPAHKRKHRKAVLPYPSAADKVKYYWGEAKKMINEGGWKQI